MSAVGGFLSADGRALTLEAGEASATLVLTPLTDTAAEGAEDVVLRIDPLSFVVRTYDGTAVAGDDYKGYVGTVYLDPGTTSATISIRLLGDRHLSRRGRVGVDPGGDRVGRDNRPLGREPRECLRRGVEAVAGQLGAALAKSANPMPDDAGHAAVPYWWALVALALAFCLRRGFFALPTR